MKKNIANPTQTTGTISANAQGAKVTVNQAKTISAACVVTGTGTGSVQFQKSIDGINWANDGSAVSVSGAGTYWLEKIDPTSIFMRVSYVVSTGSYASSTTILILSEQN